MQVIDICLVIITIVLYIIGYVFMHRYLKQYNSEPDNKEKQVKTDTLGIKIYGAVGLLLTVGVALLLIFIYKQNTFVFNIKRIALLTLLWPIAWIDFQTYRIPNMYILLGITYRILIIPCEIVFDSPNAFIMILSDLIASIALFLAAFICRLIVKNSIGAGDMKLFFVMGILLGLQGIWGAIFMSLLVSFFVSVYLLSSKKKGRKDAIPFGPALMLGTFISVILTGM